MSTFGEWPFLDFKMKYEPDIWFYDQLSCKFDRLTGLCLSRNGHKWTKAVTLSCPKHLWYKNDSFWAKNWPKTGPNGNESSNLLTLEPPPYPVASPGWRRSQPRTRWRRSARGSRSACPSPAVWPKSLSEKLPKGEIRRPKMWPK